MKIQLLLWITFYGCISNVLGQNVFPGIVINQGNISNYGVSILNHGEIKTNGTLNIDSGNDPREIISGEGITIKPGTDISVTGSGSVHLLIDNTYDLEWFHPIANTPATVLKNDYLEVGIRLPDTLEQMITRFVSNLQGEKINPYDPEQLDIKAEFYLKENGLWVLKGKTYGFYYQDFERNAQDWSEIPTDHRMRIRYTPEQEGEWKCIIGFRVNEGNPHYAHHFYFEVTNSNLPGFLKVGNNKRYLTQNGQPYFPVGQNFPQPFSLADLDATWQYGTQRTMYPESYLKFYEEIETFSNAGGNYIRTLLTPESYEIEFEGLNNYSNRLSNAWEMDHLLEVLKDENVRMHLNLMVHYPLLSVHPYGGRMWDWTANDHPIYSTFPGNGCVMPNDSGYCYSSELNILNPRDFLTEQDVRENFKKKLRYIISRWGYSPNIGGFELISEFNSLWNNVTFEDPPDCRAKAADGLKHYRDNLDNIPAKVADFNIDMAEYIKDELVHNQHILNACYAGTPNIDDGDDTWLSDKFDLISFNHYQGAPDKYKRMSHVYYNSYNNQQLADYYIDKPIINSEAGIGDDRCDRETSWMKTVLLSPFTGFTGAFPWYNSNSQFVSTNPGDPYDPTRRDELWQLFGFVKDFMAPYHLDAENWRPGFYEHPDQYFDVLYLSNPDKSEIIGAIHNRTWNFYTQRDLSMVDSRCELTPFQLQSFPSQYQTSQNITSSVYGPGIIYGTLPDVTYQVEYFDPFQGTSLGVLPWDSELDGTNYFPTLDFGYPFLTADSTRPILYFKATALQSSQMALSDNPLGTMSDEQTQAHIDRWLLSESYRKLEKLDDPLQLPSTDTTVQEDRLYGTARLHPNPTSKNCVVEVTGDSYNRWVLKTTTGAIVKKGAVHSSIFEVELADVVSGIYLFKLFNEKNNTQTTFKIVKL